MSKAIETLKKVPVKNDVLYEHIADTYFYQRSRQRSFKRKLKAATANLSLHLGPVTQARTRLRVAVLDEGGRVVAADQVRRLRATSLRLRLNLGTLPEPGYYRLRLTLVDQAGQEWAREDVPFRVIAPPAFAPAGS